MTRGITDNSVVYEYLFLATHKMFDLTLDLTQPMQAVAKGDITDSKDSDKHQTVLISNSKETQANVLIYSMREETDGILYSFGLSNGDRKKHHLICYSDAIVLLSNC